MSENDDARPDPVPMIVTGLMLDASSNVPIVILRDLDRTLFLPIWIGAAEAQAIALRLEGMETPRPLTHDLLLRVCEQLGAKVNRIVVSDLREGTFIAEIHIGSAESPRIVDARPSDAIALALRAEAPIFVRQSVLDQAQVVAASQNPEEDAERIRRILEEMNPNEPGRYTM